MRTEQAPAIDPLALTAEQVIQALTRHDITFAQPPTFTVMDREYINELFHLEDRSGCVPFLSRQMALFVSYHTGALGYAPERNAIRMSLHTRAAILKTMQRENPEYGFEILSLPYLQAYIHQRNPNFIATLTEPENFIKNPASFAESDVRPNFDRMADKFVAGVYFNEGLEFYASTRLFLENNPNYNFMPPVVVDTAEEDLTSIQAALTRDLEHLNKHPEDANKRKSLLEICHLTHENPNRNAIGYQFVNSVILAVGRNVDWGLVWKQMVDTPPRSLAEFFNPAVYARSLPHKN